MRCPVCSHWVDDDDYWCGDKCLRCALDEERKRLAHSNNTVLEDDVTAEFDPELED